MNSKEIKIGKISYLGQWPGSALKVVRPVLEPLSWLIPSWANELNARWENNSECAIFCNIEYDYRRVNLSFCPQFLEATPDYRRYMTIHDLLHGFSLVLHEYAENEIKALVPDDDAPKFQAALLRELDTRHESMTQDLAFCLSRKLTASLDA